MGEQNLHIHLSPMREQHLLLLILLTFVIAGISTLIYLSASKKSRKSKSVNSTVTGTKMKHQSFTVAEVAKHNLPTDCWIIIKDKVYDVTSYVEEHPGGYAILNHAGGDSTEGFYGPQHATRVFDMVDEFYIGELAP